MLECPRLAQCKKQLSRISDFLTGIFLHLTTKKNKLELPHAFYAKLSCVFEVAMLATVN